MKLSENKEERDAAFTMLVEAEEAKKLKKAKRIERVLMSLSALMTNPIVKVILITILAYFAVYWCSVLIWWPIKFFIELW